MLVESDQGKMEIELVGSTTGNVILTSPTPFGAAEARQAGFRQRKNLLAMQDLTAMKLLKLRAEKPKWALKDVLAEVIKGYPMEMPADVLLQMVQFICGQWEKTEPLHQQATA